MDLYYFRKRKEKYEFPIKDYKKLAKNDWLNQ